MHLNIFELKLGAYIRYGKTRQGHKSSVRRKNFPYVRNTSFWCHAYNQGELCSNFFLQNVKIVSNSRTFWKFKTVHWRIKLKEAEIKLVRSQKRSSVQLFWNYCQPSICQEKVKMRSFEFQINSWPQPYRVRLVQCCKRLFADIFCNTDIQWGKTLLLLKSFNSRWFHRSCLFSFWDWKVSGETYSVYNLQDEDFVLRRNVFGDYHLPSNWSWKKVHAKEQNEQHVKIQQVCLLRFLGAAVYQQLNSCFPIQNAEKARDAILYGWWRGKLYRRVLVERTTANSAYNRQL